MMKKLKIKVIDGKQTDLVHRLRNLFQGSR